MGNLRLYKYDVIPSRIARMVTIDFNSGAYLVATQMLLAISLNIGIFSAIPDRRLWRFRLNFQRLVRGILIMLSSFHQKKYAYDSNIFLRLLC